jgi:hypothetical protein
MPLLDGEKWQTYANKRKNPSTGLTSSRHSWWRPARVRCGCAGPLAGVEHCTEHCDGLRAGDRVTLKRLAARLRPATTPPAPRSSFRMTARDALAGRCVGWHASLNEGAAAMGSRPRMRRHHGPLLAQGNALRSPRRHPTAPEPQQPEQPSRERRHRSAPPVTRSPATHRRG